MIIKGNEEFIIDGKEFTISNGNIYIYDNGKLIIRNSTFYFLSDYHAQRTMMVENYGHVEIINSEIIAPYEVVTSFQDNSYLYVNNSNTGGLELVGLGNSQIYVKNSVIPDLLYPISEWYEPQAGELVEIEVHDSEIGHLPLTFPSNSTATIDGIHKGLQDHLELSGRDLGYHLILINTKVSSIYVAVEMNANVILKNSNLTHVYIKNLASLKIINSTLETIAIQLRQIDSSYECHVKDLRSGYFDYFDIYDISTGLNLNLILENTTLGLDIGWSFNPHNIDLTLENSRDVSLRPWDASEIEVNNTHLFEQWFDGFNGTIIYRNSVIDKWTNTWDSNFEFKGTVEITDTSDIIGEENGPCRNIIIRREFPVITYDGCSKLSGADLRVLSPQGNEVWNGYSNGTGEAFFTLNFDCTNYNKEYIIKSNILDEEIKFKLGSSTPLIIPPPHAPILNSIGDKSIYINKELKFKVTANDEKNCPLTYKASPLPEGASFDIKTGKFSWIPSAGQIGSYDIRFSVSNGLAEDFEDVTIIVLPLFPPINVSLNQEIKEYLFIDIINNMLTWEANQSNTSINIIQYNIYRRVKGAHNFNILASVPSDKFTYRDENLGKRKYEYALTSVTNDGYESDFSNIVGN